MGSGPLTTCGADSPDSNRAAIFCNPAVNASSAFAAARLLFAVALVSGALLGIR
jgi:hypothetical protein